MLKGNLFLYERVNIFELDERVFSNCGQLFECSFFYVKRVIPNGSHFRLCEKKTHTDKQRNKHTFETKEKEKQTDTEKETETISIFLSDSCSDSFSRGNIKQKTKD